MSRKMTTCFLISVYINDDFEDFKLAIESCINQTVIVDKIIIVFDGDVKNSVSKYCYHIEKFHKEIEIVIVKCKTNIGLGAALNKGLKSSNEDIIFRMDSDDISRKNRVEEIMKFFKKHEDVGIVGSYISEFNEKLGDIHRIRKVPLNSDKILKQLKFSCPFNHVSVAFRLSVLPCNPYETKYHRLEDYPTWYNLLVKHKLKCANINKVLVDVKLGKEFLNKRRGFILFKSLFKVYLLMYNENYINFLIFTRNVVIRFIQFVIIPKKILNLLYILVRK